MRSLERVRSDLSGLKVPVVTTYTTPEMVAQIHNPTLEDPQGPIFEKMKSMADSGMKPIIKAGYHHLYGMESLVPHYKDSGQTDNLVYWVAEQSQDKRTIVPWNINDNISWKKLAQDDEFLSALEEKARDEVRDGGGSFFFLFGWSPVNPSPPKNVARRAVMSQISAHFHRIGPESIKHADKEIYLVEGKSSEDLLKFSLFLDFGAEVAHHELETRFKKFGGRNLASHEHEWTQCNDKVHRHAFGFLNLTDVMRQLVGLDEDLKDAWPLLVPHLAEEYKNDYLFPFEGGNQSLLLLPPCVTASVFVPSPADKAQMGLHENDPHIWVVPFSLTDKKVLVDGHWTERKVK